ncbi:hypothetical protein [Microbacterium atlanticum]|uniref:hypothetical protein n=1 Tax=Microbacterium atlanticum TaxID=2782168 RepID=UPI001E34BDEB|nr:hypothetical protein [Microbacterium atlanticum]
MHVQRRRRMVIVTVIVGAFILALLITVGVYGLLRGPASARTDSPTASATSASVSPSIGQPRALPATTSAATFGHSVALTLFRWDTRGSMGPSDWAQALVEVADPEEAAGLASDVRAYMPSSEQWEQLKLYGTRQWLTIDSAEIPKAWAAAVAQAAPGQLPPGATAYTISGVRHREGIWDDEVIATSSDVRFTVFLACPRAGECRLLRLSRLNEPLE